MRNIEPNKKTSKKLYAGLIIAGGSASRLGGPKHDVVLGNKRLWLYAAEGIKSQVDMLAINMPWGHTIDGYEVLTEAEGEKAGPLAAVLLGLQWAQKSGAHYLVTMPVDVPFFPDDFVDQLHVDADDILMPRYVRVSGRAHNLCAIWPISIFTKFEQAFGQGVRAVYKMHNALASKAVVFSPDNEFQFMNINTPDDLTRAQRTLSVLEGHC